MTSGAVRGRAVFATRTTSTRARWLREHMACGSWPRSRRGNLTTTTGATSSPVHTPARGASSSFRAMSRAGLFACHRVVKTDRLYLPLRRGTGTPWPGLADYHPSHVHGRAARGSGDQCHHASM